MQLEDWLDDLCVRFVVNIPSEELSSVERICFQVEEAQWFYEDFIRPLDPTLPSLTLKPFFHQITQRCPLFREWSSDETNAAFEQFLKYKNRVPVRGAILLNEAMDEVLLVRGFKKGGTWSFPRGKINKDEDDLDCAVREAWEETGFDLKAAGLLKDPKKIRSIEMTMRNQNMKLYVFRGVPMHTQFIPQTRKEIGKIAWYKLADLPTLKKKQGQQDIGGQQLILNANKFYMVAPFVQPLKKIIAQEKKRDSRLMAQVNLATVNEPDATLAGPSITKSPYVPSSLPEVTQSSSQDPLIGLRQQLNIAAPASGQPVAAVDHAKSNALLSLLRGGPQDSISSAPTSSLLTAPTTGREESWVPRLSPAQSSNYSSTLPRLDSSQRSLLDVFNVRDTVRESQAQNGMPDLPAAFSGSQVVPQVADTSRPETTLLNLFRAAHSVATPQPPVSQDLDHVTDHASPGDDNSTSKITPTSNPLLALLTRVPTAAAAGSAPTRSKTADAVKNTALEDSTHTPVEFVSRPTEAQPDAASMKNGLLALLKDSSSTEASHKQRNSKTSPISSDLNRPAPTPERYGSEVISTSTFERRSQKTPAAENRKLFNPKADEKRIDTPNKVRVKHEGRDQSHGSPRSAKTRVASSPRRPQIQTSKEPSKPFQPQILKRPQSSHSDTPTALSLPRLESLFARSNLGDDVDNADKAADSGQPPDLPSPSLRHTPMQNLTNKPVLQPPPPDPQREALLSLLKGPVQDVAVVTSPPIGNTDSPVPLGAQNLEQVVSPVTVIDQQQRQLPIEPVSRVTSFASTTSIPNNLSSSTFTTSARSPIEKRQTAASDKAFLMTYLQKFANQENATPASTNTTTSATTT